MSCSLKPLSKSKNLKMKFTGIEIIFVISLDEAVNYIVLYTRPIDNSIWKINKSTEAAIKFFIVRVLYDFDLIYNYFSY